MFGAAGLAGEARWTPAFGLIRKVLASATRLLDCDQDVGEDRSDHEVDLVAFEQPLDLGHGDIRLQLVVDDHDVDVATTHLAAEIA